MNLSFRDLDKYKGNPIGKTLSFNDCECKNGEVIITENDTGILLINCKTFRQPCDFAWEYHITKNGFTKCPITDWSDIEKVRNR